MGTKDKEVDDFKWTVDQEINLFEAMTNYKIAGKLKSYTIK